MSEQKGIGASSRQKLSKVIKVSSGGLTPELVSKTLAVNKQEAGRLLSRWCKAGWLKRVKRGFYISIPIESSPDKLAIENPWVIVSKIFGQGYIGGFSAIKHWDLSEQIFETITYFTTKKIKEREPRYSGLKIHLKTISEDKIFGTKTVWIDSSKILVSDPTKTIVDMLDDPFMGGGMRVISDFFSNYIESDYKNFDLLFEYAKKMKNNTIFKRLGYLMETLNLDKPKFLERIKNEISKGYSKFDPTSENTKIIRRWNLKIPASWVTNNDRKK